MDQLFDIASREVEMRVKGSRSPMADIMVRMRKDTLTKDFISFAKTLLILIATGSMI